jgi:hypothetical protein
MKKLLLLAFLVVSLFGGEACTYYGIKIEQSISDSKKLMNSFLFISTDLQIEETERYLLSVKKFCGEEQYQDIKPNLTLIHESFKRQMVLLGRK